MAMIAMADWVPMWALFVGVTIVAVGLVGFLLKLLIDD